MPAASLQVSGRWNPQVRREHSAGRVTRRKGPSIPNLLASFLKMNQGLLLNFVQLFFSLCSPPFDLGRLRIPRVDLPHVKLPCAPGVIPLDHLALSFSHTDSVCWRFILDFCIND